MSIREQILAFGMQNLQLEVDLAHLEKSGVEIGHTKTIRSDAVVDVELFDKDLLQQARKMADFYVIYYLLENTIRRLISERLSDKHGANWWDKVPQGVKDAATDKQAKEKDSVLSLRDDPLFYTNFGELITIMDANWDCFADTIRSRKAMQLTLSQFNQVRNIIAHSCELSDNDITRLKLLVNDWVNIQT